MNDDLILAVDRYIDDLYVPADPALDATLRSTVEAGMPEIQISPNQGKLLYLLARIQGARKILEVGTLAGYSAIWLGRALTDGGKLITLEFDPKHAAVARKNLERAGLGDRAEVRVGPALESLAAIAKDGEGPFDVVFIDADKVNYPNYLERALGLTRSGSLILADNVVRAGQVINPAEDDASAKATHAFNAAIASDPRLEAVVLQQVGIKGHDGLALVRVR